MIVMYLRSSAIGTHEMCEMKYFFQYVLGMKDKTNKKAVMGTIFHRAMQALADKKLAQKSNKKKLKNDDIRDLTFAECDNIPLLTELCFGYYAEHEDVSLTKADLRTCTKWVQAALDYNGGIMDPRNQDIFATEQFFDIEIPHDWAKYDYKVGDKTFSGQLSIKGTVDLILKENDAYFQILDYKTGKRLNWATGKEKTLSDLYSDKQLLLYYYAMKNLFPEKSFYISIFYLNDGGLFDIVFADEAYAKAEKMLKSKFEELKRCQVPKQLSQDQTDWKCTRLCQFSDRDQETGLTVCQNFHNLVKRKGMDYVVENYANLNKLGKYGSGGGRIDTES